MVSRRRFLQVGGVAAIAASPLGASGKPETKADASLAPALARLKSRKDEAKPITREERQQRQERARQLMTENELDAILLMEGTSLKYFTGIRWWGGERLFALILPAKGIPFYVCPAFEEGRAREQIANPPDRKDPDVRVWQEDENPYQLIAPGLTETRVPRG